MPDDKREEREPEKRRDEPRHWGRGEPWRPEERSSQQRREDGSDEEERNEAVFGPMN